MSPSLSSVADPHYSLGSSSDHAQNVPDAPLTTRVGCFNETRTEIPTAETCPVADWCGLKVTDKPRQRYRFIVPVVSAGRRRPSLQL